ncbi:hypothetical protein Tco_0643137, partial [Tanacetum coccineum]
TADNEVSTATSEGLMGPIPITEDTQEEDQRAQIARDAEIARQWDEEERKRVMDEAKATKKIDWNDPSVL